MAGITQAQAQTQYDLWLAAAATVATGQAYSIGGRSLTRADSADIREWITFWDDKLKELSTSATGLVISQAAPKN